MESTVEQAQQSNTKSFVAAAIVGLIAFAAELLLFIVLHRRLKYVYTPRAVLGEDGTRAKALPSNWFKAVWDLLWRQDTEVLRLNGVDAYLVLRWFRLLVSVFTFIHECA